MANAGSELHNPRTGQTIRFVRPAKDTGGVLLEMVSTYAEGSTEPVAHYHPEQQEDFTVLEGALQVRMAGTVRTLRTGEQLHIPANTIHSMWNAGPGRTVVNWQVRPALRTEEFFEVVYGLAKDGRVDRKGMPSLPQTALLMNRYHRTFRLAAPPFPIQRVVFVLLTPIAWLMGLRSSYRQYLDR